MTLDLLLYHLTLLGIALLLAQSLNLVWQANLFSLGHHGFAAIGAYVSAVVTSTAVCHYLPSVAAGVTGRLIGAGLLLLSVVTAAVIAAVIGYALMLLLYRLRGDYFAVATLVLAEMIRLALANTEAVGGAQGIEMPYLVWTRRADQQSYYLAFYLTLVAVFNVALFLGLHRLARSPVGRSITAIRDNELAAELIGVPVTVLHRAVFAFAVGVAGAAGAIEAQFRTIVTPDDFSFINGLIIVLYVVLGRLGNVRCVIATVAVYTSYELVTLRLLGLFGPTIGEWIAQWKEVFLAATLVIGLVGPVLARSIPLLLRGDGANGRVIRP